MARIAVTYYSIADIHWSSVAIVDVDRHWTSFRLAVRNDQTGIWDFHRLGDPLPPKPLTPITAGFQQLDASLGPAKEVFRSMVKVHANLPCPIEGFPKTRKQGAGLILDAERGLVVVSRNIIPFTLGDFSLTFADSIILPGKVEFLHPLHNFAIVSYDPRLIGDTPVQSATLSEVPLGQGHATTLAAMNHNYRPICNTTVVTDITTVTIPSAPVPRFRAVNFDAITVDTPLAQHCSSGVLCDADGRVQALWLSHLGDRNGKSDTEYYLGIHIALVKPILERFQQHVALPPVPPTGPVVVPPCDTFLRLWGFAIEVVPVQMSTARQMGVTDDWVRRVEAANPQRHQLFMVRRTEAQTPTAEVLHELDLILAVRGRTVAHIHDLEVQYTGIDVVTAPVVPMTVLRNKQELALEVPLTRFESEGTRDVLMWSGAILQEPHRA
ncbi:trypsin-like serine protease, partial [Caulochytrium protostelioides]